MSIVTLKRKTQVQYNNMSVGKPNFSLNGTLRNQGYVGQTSLSRSLPKTPMKGNVACGHGGCCGTFRKMPIVQTVNPIAVTMNNTNAIKSSVINTNGLINTKYRWVKRPQPYSTVKPDNNQNINDQSNYITNLSKKTVGCIATYDISNKINIFNKNLTPKHTCPEINSYFKTDNKTCEYTKPYSIIPISQGEYLTQLHNDCTKNDIKFVPAKTQRAPFTGSTPN
jgi:hypothetical protein